MVGEVVQSVASKPTSEDVITALRGAGWLLEQETAAGLEAGGFHATTASAFPDPQDPTVSREIDVHGYRQLYQSSALSLTVSARVLAECKQSSMPYVVVGGPASEYELRRDRKEQQFRFPYINTGRTDLDDGASRIHQTRARTYLGLDGLPGNPWESMFVGTQMTRLDRKKTWLADNRGIFTSLVYPLAKALTYYRSQANRSAYVEHRPGRDWAHVTFFYPVVVTSAPIYAVDASVSPYRAVEVPWVTTTREIRSAKIDGHFNTDIVTAESLGDYLAQRINRFVLAVGSIADREPERFVTYENYGYVSPAD